MIFTGLNQNQKQFEIIRYVHEHDIKNVIVLSPDKFYLQLPDCGCPIRQIEYDETIMYRTFYPLIDEIDESYLIVFNEFMRDRKRGNLTYNCCAKYTNQTPHRLVFEYVPIIQDINDLMILIDFDTSQQYKMRGLDAVSGLIPDIKSVKHDYRLIGIDIDVPDTALGDYQRETDNAFANIGVQDPDVIPRRLHKWANRFRKPYIKADISTAYLAGAVGEYNHIPNIKSRKCATKGDSFLADLPFARKEWNDLYRMTEMTEFRWYATPLKVDTVYQMMWEEWRKELENVYAKTGVYAGNG